MRRLDSYTEGETCAERDCPPLSRCPGRQPQRLGAAVLCVELALAAGGRRVADPLHRVAHRARLGAVPPDRRHEHAGLVPDRDGRDAPVRHGRRGVAALRLRADGRDGRVILRDYAMRGRPILRGAIAKGGTGRWMACRPLRRMPLYPDPRPRRPGRGRAARPDDGGVPDRCDGLPVCRNPQRLAVGGGGLRALLRCGADHQAHRSAADCGATSAGALCSARAWKARRIAEPWLAAPCGGCHSGLSHRSGSRAHFSAAGAGACRLLRQSSRTRSLLLRAGTSPVGIPAAAQRLAPAAFGFALAGGAGATPSEAGLGACSTGLRRALRTGSPTWFRRADFRIIATRCLSSCCR